MRRFLRFVMQAALVVVVALVSFIAVDVASSPGNGPMALGNGLTAGGIGLVLGLLVAWMRGVPWKLIPVVMRLGSRRLQHEFWWITAGAGALAVLVLY